MAALVADFGKFSKHSIFSQLLLSTDTWTRHSYESFFHNTSLFQNIKKKNCRTYIALLEPLKAMKLYNFVELGLTLQYMNSFFRRFSGHNLR